MTPNPIERLDAMVRAGVERKLGLLVEYLVNSRRAAADAAAGLDRDEGLALDARAEALDDVLGYLHDTFGVGPGRRAPVAPVTPAPPRLPLRLPLRPPTAPAAVPAAVPGAELPPVRHVSDEDEALFLARRYGRFE